MNHTEVMMLRSKFINRKRGQKVGKLWKSCKYQIY